MIYYKYLITTSDGLFNGKADKKESDRVNDILNEFNSNLEEGDLSINVTSIEKTQLKLSISSSLNSESDIEREIVSLLQALGINPKYSIEKEEVSVKEFAKSAKIIHIDIDPASIDKIIH